MVEYIDKEKAVALVEAATGKAVAMVALLRMAPEDVVPVVRCKDCKHRPTGTDRDDLKFPDDKCPCQCEDFWYSWKSADDWFCGNGERKDGEQE